MILAVNSCTVVDEPALTCLPPCAGSPTSCPTTTAGSSSSPRTTRRARTLSTPTSYQASTPSGSSSSLRYVIVNSQREFIVTQAYYLQLPTGVNRYAIVNHTTPSGSFAKIKKTPSWVLMRRRSYFCLNDALRNSKREYIVTFSL